MLKALPADHRPVAAGLIGVAVVAALGLIIALIVWPTAELLTSAYNRDPVLLAVAAPALVLATLFFVADAIQVVAASARTAARRGSRASA